jgi:hypothetical protein
LKTHVLGSLVSPLRHTNDPPAENVMGSWKLF